MDIFEEHSIPHEFRVISFITFGLTAFTIIAMLAIIRNFIDQGQALEKLKKNEFMEIIAGGIAHDFNNLLGIILGNAELAMDDMPEWHPAKSNLNEIRTASLRARDVVRQLLSFSRKTDPKQRPAKLVHIVEDALKFLRSSTPTSIEIHLV